MSFLLIILCIIAVVLLYKNRFIGPIIDFILVICTGGLWLIWLVIRASRRDD